MLVNVKLATVSKPECLTPSVSEEGNFSLNMEGLAEHEILAGTYEAYLLAYRIGRFSVSMILE